MYDINRYDEQDIWTESALHFDEQNLTYAASHSFSPSDCRDAAHQQQS